MTNLKPIALEYVAVEDEELIVDTTDYSDETDRPTLRLRVAEEIFLREICR